MARPAPSPLPGLARATLGAVNPAPDPATALGQLLGSLFDDAELRRFVGGLDGGAELRRELPGPGVALASLADAAGRLLERRGLLREAALWVALERERPQVAAELSALRARMWTGAPEFPGYEILGTAGHGGSGTVYLARDRESGQRRAIKVVELARGQKERQRLRDEYRRLDGLRHPALLRVYHLEVEPGRVWMVCEHLGGGTLAARLDRQPTWTDLEIARLGLALAGALGTLHGLSPPVIHRDLSANNVLFDEVGGCRLIDLGHARELEGAGHTRGPASGYPAPEVLGKLRGVATDHRADLFSLCSLLVRVALPDEPAEWPEYAAEVRAALKGRDPRLIAALARGCEKMPANRFPSADALAAALAEIVDGEDARVRREAEAARVRERADLLARIEAGAAEREALAGRLEAVTAARDLAREQLERASAERNAAVGERDRARAEATALHAAAGEATSRRDQEIKALRGAREEAGAQVTGLTAELSRAQAALERAEREQRGRISWGVAAAIALVGFGAGLALGGLLGLGAGSPGGGGEPKPVPTLIAAAPSPACSGPAIGGPIGTSHTARKGTSAPIPFIGLSAGSFCMGSPDGEGEDDERPQRRVTVTGFLIGTSEVTQAQWRAAVVAGKAAGDAEAAELNEDPSRFKGETRPVEQVSWCDAVRFANVLSRLDGRRPVYTVGADCERRGKPSLDPAADGYRLPTEAEWEYAARLGTSGRWSFGEDEGRLCSFGNVADLSAKRSWDATLYANCDDGYAETAPACSLQPNPWGLCDVHGNVWEWAGDWYADAYDPADLADPAGPPAGSHRVIRGGSYNNGPGLTRSADRSRNTPSDSGSNLGFRLVVSAASPSGGP